MSNKFLKLGLPIYQKVLLTFIAMIIPIYTVSLYINIRSSAYVTEQACNSAKSQAEYFARNLGNEYNLIIMQIFNILNDNTIERYCVLNEYISDYEKSYAQNLIRERLITIKNSSNMVRSAGFYIKSLDKSFHTEKSYGTYFQDNPDEAIHMEGSMLYDISNKKIGKSLYFYENQLLLIIPFSSGGITTPAKANLIMYVRLSKEYLTETLSQLAAYEGSGAFISANDSEFTISTINNMDISNLSSQNKEKIEETTISLMEEGSKKIWTTLTPVKEMGMRLGIYIPENQLVGTIKIYKILFIILSVISLVIIAGFAYTVNIMIHKPLMKLIRAFKMTEADKLDISILHKSNDEFNYLYKSFDHMVLRLKRSIEQNYEYKIALQQAEFKQLQSQINPHFLYNSFYNIYRIYKLGDHDSVALVMKKMGRYFQFITRNGEAIVKLNIEVEHARDYADIQQVRFSNRVCVEFGEVPEEYADHKVPRLILQPLIENAYTHGLKDCISAGRVKISFVCSHNGISIVVEDNCSDLSDEEIDRMSQMLVDKDILESTGMINIHKRLVLRHGEESGLFLSRSSIGGLKAEIVIRYKGGESYVQTADR